MTFQKELVDLHEKHPNLKYFQKYYDKRKKYKLEYCRYCNCELSTPIKHIQLKLCEECYSSYLYLKHMNKKTIYNSTKAKKYNQKIRIDCLKHYSKGSLKCAKCGYGDLRALTIDHICGDGYEHRKKIKTRQIGHYLKSHNYPEGYQVLCMNCQMIKKYDNNEMPYSKRSNGQNESN